MSKTKMRCMTCGKWFQSANAKEVTCPDCTQKARKEKLAQKNAPTTMAKTGASTPTATAQVRPPAPPKPKTPAGGTIQWLDKVADVKIAQPEPPAPKPKIPSPPVQRETTRSAGGNRNDSNGSEQAGRGSPPYRDRTANGATGPSSAIGQRPQPRQPMGGQPGATGSNGRPWQKGSEGSGGAKPRGKPKARPSAPPRPKKEKTPPPPPFVPTAEQIKQVEERYSTLSQPAEFDGIRTQISKELSIPKKAVKKIIKDFRSQEHIPSWWELQTYKGSSEELEKIKAVYQPYLPVPPVGVHKIIAETLALKPSIVYQAIKAIRQELELPQYNDPDLHEEELKQIAAEKHTAAEQSNAEPGEGASKETQTTVTEEQQPVATVAAEQNEEKHDEQPERQEASEAKEDVTVQE